MGNQIKKLFITNRKSAKTGKIFTCVVADLGYTEKILNFDLALCAELAGVTQMEIYEFRESGIGKEIILFEAK